jgi:hypothetical protein
MVPGVHLVYVAISGIDQARLLLNICTLSDCKRQHSRRQVLIRCVNEEIPLSDSLY